MSFYRPGRSLPHRFRLVQASFLDAEGLPFADVLPEAAIQQAFDEEGVDFAQEEDALYTPPLTLWAFLSQMLHKAEQRSCVAAVARVMVLLTALGREPPSGNTGAYCRARAKLPEPVIRRLTLRMVAELDIRAIKITLDMDVLRCKTPAMVRREIWAHLLAYNMIRRSILQSAQASGCSPRELSFTAAMQGIAASWTVAVLANPDKFGMLVNAHLANVSGHRVGNRPNRVEPRATKRRPKPHRLLTKPRAEARLDVLAGVST